MKNSRASLCCVLAAPSGRLAKTRPAKQHPSFPTAANRTGNAQYFQRKLRRTKLIRGADGYLVLLVNTMAFACQKHNLLISTR